MSIHFAPQYAKPIKPTGSSLTPTTDTPPILSKSSLSTVPFPALSATQRSSSPTTATPAGQPLSYSRVTHTPVSPAFAHDGSYFPLADGVGANTDGHPFRYSAETMLSLWDEEKVRTVPIELTDLADGGAGLVSRVPRKPAGLSELSEQQKKLLASSIHPPVISRRQNTANGVTNPSETPAVNGGPRRPTGGTPGSKEVGFGGGRMGGFGRGEGGAFGGGRPGSIGGGVLGPNGEGKMPGTIGGGFGGVGRRIGRGRLESGDAGDGTRIGSTPWRPARTASGTFEGVLGFGGSFGAGTTQPTPPAAPDTQAEHVDPAISQQIQSPNGSWREKNGESREKAEVRKDKEGEHPAFGSGGGPGWGSGPKKWRQAAVFAAPPDVTGDKPLAPHLDLPSVQTHHIPDSAIATASATPIPERDATMVESEPPSRQPEELAAPPMQSAEMKEDLGAVEWLYRDPGGLEQGPFTGAQMHDWYTHSYFADDLPIRRVSHATYITLGELKASTGNAVQPFLSVARPRNPPPNLPFPASALAANHTSLADSFRTLNVQNALIPGAIVSPIAQSHIINNYPAERNPLFAAGQFSSQPLYQPAPATAAPFGPSPGQPWGVTTQPFGGRFNAPFAASGIPAAIGSSPLYNPQQQPNVYSPLNGVSLGDVRSDLFSPSVGAGAIPVSPWGVTHPSQQSSPFQQIPSMPVWQPPLPQPNRPGEVPADTPSYFPAADEITPEQIEQVEEEAAPERDEFVAVRSEEVETFDVVEAVELVEATEATESIDKEHTSSDSEPTVATPDQAVTPPAEPAVPTPRSSATPVSSVWGQKASPIVKAPTERQPSNTPAPTAAVVTAPTASSRLPPAPASLPAKPVSARAASISEAAKPPSAQQTVSTPEKGSLPSRPAPWAAVAEPKVGRTPSTGPSLRDIQEAESKQAEVRKQALAAARGASPAFTPSIDDVPTSMTWGLPSQASKNAQPAPAPAVSPALPAWGSGDAGPKRTLKQIQEEEEKRKAKLAAQQRALQAAVQSGSNTAVAAAAAKRGYADLAANSTIPQPIAGWTTVGSSGKPSGALPAKPAALVASSAKPAAPVSATPVQSATTPKAAKTNGTDEYSAPSVEFIRWVKVALTGLNAPIDEFVQMLLSFPIDPPASQRPEVLEIISDSVYASSATLDGRRFAQEFYTKRKADASRPKDPAAAAKKVGSLAEVVKAVPKKTEDAGFKVVKAKGKKKN